MFRLLRLGLFFYASTWLVLYLAARTSISVEPSSFLAGVIAAAFTGFAELQISEWWSTVVKPFKPQTVKLETKETPSSITSAASKARLLGGGVFGTASWYVQALVDPTGSLLIRFLVSTVIGIATFVFLLILAALTNRQGPKAKNESGAKS